MQKQKRRLNSYRLSLSFTDKHYFSASSSFLTVYIELMIIIYIQNNKKAQIKQKRKANRIQFQSEREKESKEGKETKQRSFLHFSDSGEREREKKRSFLLIQSVEFSSVFSLAKW